ncbi:MAG: hypothetical protein IT518_09755, partial [Burkholderiales bacterium]|nr:hypothetical protein [Burkholderiales bacterium]
MKRPSSATAIVASLWIAGAVHAEQAAVSSGPFAIDNFTTTVKLTTD